MKYIIILFCFLFSFVTGIASEAKEVDSIRTYRLGEIVAESGKISKSSIVGSVNKLDYYQLQRTDATSLTEISKYLSSGYVQTNSRGETLLFLRGAGERQLGLYLDGVLLNVPWDNRVDFSTIPIDIIGKIFVNKGTSSILYGANVLGGAMNISSLERQNEGMGWVGRVQFGDANTQSYSLTNDGKYGNLNYIANISYSGSDGFLLADGGLIDSLSQNPNSSLRTNTDYKRLSTYLRAEYEFGDDLTFGLSYNHSNNEKGIAVLAGIKDAKSKDLRFWKYPEIRRDIITLNSEFVADDNLTFKAVLWYDIFGQTIDAYKDISYSELSQKQIDADKTLGARISADYLLNDYQNLVFAVNALQTDHSETIFANFNKTISDFAQQTISAGLEHKLKFNDFLIATGVVWDYNKNPKTGNYIEHEGLSSSDFGFFAGLNYSYSDNIDVFVNSSRRTRFPTMRESFSGALNKFVVNPELKPETGLINELGIKYSKADFTCELTGFATLYDDLIDQIKLSADVDSLKRNMRVNFAKATIAGVEAQFAYRPLKGFFADGYLTYMYSSGEKDGEEIEHLEYKPELMGILSTGYKFDFGFTPSIELEYMGRQWGLGLNDEGYVELDNYLNINIRLSYGLLINEIFSEIYLRLNNLTNESSYSKIGLPNVGRTIMSGISVRI
jgi:iron complex outermembrane receptor protein